MTRRHTKDKELLHVAMIEPVGGHSGMDYYDFGLCQALTKNQIQVTLYTCDETDLPSDSGYKTKRLYKGIYGTDNKWIRGFRYIRGTMLTFWDITKKNSQICHFHFFHVGVLELFNLLACQFLNVKILITVHDIESLASKKSTSLFAKVAYRLAHCLIVHNYVSQRELISKTGADRSKIFVIPHGSYLHAINRKNTKFSARSYLDLSEDAKVLLFFGQIKSVKGLDILLNALPPVVHRYPGTILFIAGRLWKDNFEKYAKIIEDKNLGSHCRLRIEYIAKKEADNLFSAADLLVLPYRKIYQSGVLLMGMSYGTAVLASDLDGMLEIIEDGENGFVFPAHDSDALSQRLMELLAEPQKLQQAADKALQLMENEYSWSVVAKKTAAAYMATLDE